MALFSLALTSTSTAAEKKLPPLIAVRKIAKDPAVRESFQKDPKQFLQDYDLTDQERKALAEKDYGALYALGAHPFLLQAFVMTVFPGDKRILLGEYVKAITPWGYPDFST